MSLESLVGNLFVLAAVVVILVVYRQLDKNNRSLDKIRKYADSVREDLNAFVEERTATVRDLEAVLKVHDKTGAEILKRIQALESGLLTRVPEVEQLQARLDKYSGSMTELETQTKRIDTHLERVKEETVFVDRVSQRIKTSGEQMTALEASFGKIRQDFTEINKKDLEAVRQNVSEVFEQETLAYAKKLGEAEQRVASFEAFVNELDAKRNSFVREAEAALDAKTREALAGAEAALLDTARQAEDLSMVVFLKLEEKIENQAKETETRLRTALDDSEAAVAQTTQQLSARLAAIDAAVAERTVLLDSLGARSEDIAGQLRDSFASEQTQLMSMTAQLKTDLDTAVAEVRERASDESDAMRREFHSALELDRQTSKALTQEVRDLIEATRHETQEDERRSVEAIETRLAEYETAFAYRFSQLEQAEKDLGELDKNLREAMEKAADKIQSDFAAFDTAMAGRRQEEQEALERKLGTANDSLVKLDQDLEELKSRAYDNISQKFQGVEEQFFADLQRRAASMTQSIEDWQTGLNARFDELRDTAQNERAETERLAAESLKARVQEMQTTSFQQLEKLDRQIKEAQEAAATSVATYREDVEQTRSRLAAELAELERGVEVRLGQDRSRIELSATEGLTRLERDLDAKIRSLGDELDKVRGDYQSGLDAAQSEFTQWQTRFAQRFKELDDDFREQQDVLKTSMAERIGVLTLDVETQREELVVRSAEDRQALRSDMAQIRTQVDDLDGMLRSRSQAAIDAFTREQEELSKELLERSSEDRQTLKNNIAEIHAQISELEGSLRARSQTAFDTLTNEQDALSKELLDRSSDDRQALKNDLANIRAQIDELDGSLRARSQAAIDAFTREQEAISKELLERSTDDRQELKTDLAGIRAQIGELDGTLRSRSQAALDAFRREQEELSKELLDRSSDDRQTFKSDLANIRAQIDELDGSLRSRSQAAMEAFTRDHQELAKELLERSTDERVALKSDLAQIRSAIDELDGSLRSRSQAAIESFSRGYEELSQEFQKKSRDLTTDIEIQLRDYREAVADTRDKAEAQQKKAFAKIEDQAAALTSTLEEIDKRQKGFIAQTKIFERADTLREDLTQAVEDLKADIARVEVQRKDLFEIEAGIARIKKIGDETSDKAAKFTAEKKRIDLMDADFQRIVSLSQSMELRLEQVTSSHDLLQDIQLRIRKLEEYSKDVETRYDRLEKRREVLDTTTDGVDRNFALLEKVETTVRGLDAELKVMPAEVEDLRKRLKVLAQGKEDADRAVELLRTLDTALKDVEGRINKMEQAREWIAGVETRLTETKAAADESVQTLATIHKASAAPVVKGKADGDMRNTVLKLARQGWGKEEISRATKLSLGEVELILELGTR